MSLEDSISTLYKNWEKLLQKNKDFNSSVRIDAEAIELLSPFCSSLNKAKGMYILGFNLQQEGEKNPKISFNLSSRPCVSYMRTVPETMNCQAQE